MSGFKLLGVRIFSNCSGRFSKNLNKGEIYKFYENYEYLDKDGQIVEEGNLYINTNSQVLIDNDVFEIVKKSESADKLFDIDRSGAESLKINVSALIGKNGSGKSSLLEIIYVFCYIIALKKGIIRDHSALGELINKSNVNHNKLFKKIEEIQNVYEDLRAEIYYEIDGSFFSIWSNEDQKVFHRSLSKNFNDKDFKDGQFFDPIDEETERKFNFVLDRLFYYTIAVNYSLYGLNAGLENTWLNELFHKNDGYQTPLVINPFRKDGNIDVNSELHLAQSRLLSNLVDDSFIVREIVNHKKVDSVLFTLDYSKYNSFNAIDLDTVITDIKKNLKLSDSEFITNVYNAVYTTKKSRIQQINLKNVDNSDLLVKYVYRKILKIYSGYDEYRSGIERAQSKYPLPNFNQIFRRLIELRDDRSHITLKLRQVLNAIRFNTLGKNKKNIWEEESDDFQKDSKKIKKRYIALKVEDFIARIKDINISHPDIELIELIPNACFRPTIFLRSRNSITNFHTLSSGEQHFIHSIQSILYHIANVNSVFNSKSNKIRYNYINLIFDEIELYYHPEFQRSFLSELLNGIGNLNIPHIKGINILFSSHSTFILSDIPRNSVLKLIDGQIDKRSIRTFGANIHDLLADSFFLEKGFMGKYVKQTINQTIKWLNYEKLRVELKELKEQDSTYQTDEWIRLKQKEKSLVEPELKNKDRTYHLKIIELIDEPILKAKLSEMYSEIYPDTNDEEAELKRRAEKLGYELFKKRKN